MLFNDFFKHMIEPSKIDDTIKYDSELTESEENTIIAFNNGKLDLKEEVIAIYKKHKWTSNVNSNIHLSSIRHLDT